MIFQYKYELKLSQLLKFINFKKLNILDFGCGIGNWSAKDIKSQIVEKITLYDKNKKLIKNLKKKYSNKKVNINFNYKNLKKKNNFNLILFSSVIQYFAFAQLKKIIHDFSKNKKKNLVIIITDIPFVPRLIEFILLPFFNIRRFIFVLPLIFSREYKKIDFFSYKKVHFKNFEDKFNIKYIYNLHDLKFLRYSLVMTLKK